MPIVRRYPESSRVEVIFGGGICVFEPQIARMYEITTNRADGVQNMREIGEAAHGLPFADFDPAVFVQFAERHMPARIAKITHDDEIDRQREEVRAAIRSLKAGEWTIGQIATACAELIKDDRTHSFGRGIGYGTCKIKVLPAGVRLRCFNLEDHFGDHEQFMRHNGIKRMQAAVRAVSVPAHLLVATDEFVVSPPESARERLLAESIIVHFAPDAV